jgi:hypothetical protein
LSVVIIQKVQHLFCVTETSPMVCGAKLTTIAAVNGFCEQSGIHRSIKTVVLWLTQVIRVQGLKHLLRFQIDFELFVQDNTLLTLKSQLLPAAFAHFFNKLAIPAFILAMVRVLVQQVVKGHFLPQERHHPFVPAVHVVDGCFLLW